MLNSGEREVSNGHDHSFVHLTYTCNLCQSIVCMECIVLHSLMHPVTQSSESESQQRVEVRLKTDDGGEAEVKLGKRSVNVY